MNEPSSGVVEHQTISLPYVSLTVADVPSISTGSGFVVNGEQPILSWYDIAMLRNVLPPQQLHRWLLQVAG
jgi:hypothetical protein